MNPDKNGTSCDSREVSETRQVHLLRSNLSWRSRPTSRARTVNGGSRRPGGPVSVAMRTFQSVSATAALATCLLGRPGSGVPAGMPPCPPGVLASRPPGQPRGPPPALRPRFQIRRTHGRGGSRACESPRRSGGGRAGPVARSLPRPPRPERAALRPRERGRRGGEREGEGRALRASPRPGVSRPRGSEPPVPQARLARGLEGARTPRPRVTPGISRATAPQQDGGR